MALLLYPLAVIMRLIIEFAWLWDWADCGSVGGKVGGFTDRCCDGEGVRACAWRGMASELLPWRVYYAVQSVQVRLIVPLLSTLARFFMRLKREAIKYCNTCSDSSFSHHRHVQDIHTRNEDFPKPKAAATRSQPHHSTTSPFAGT